MTWIRQNLDFDKFLPEVLKTRIARIACLSHTEGLLKSGHILPLEHTLRDYSNWMPAKPGFSVDRQLMKEAEITEIPEYKKYVCLTFDEVKVKDGLVYNKVWRSLDLSTLVTYLNICMNERYCMKEISQ